MDDRPISFWQQPVIRALGRFLIFLALYGIFYLILRFTPNLTNGRDYSIDTLVDLGLCVGGMLVWMVFFSQFVLPVRTAGDRLKIVDRMASYLTGSHGPAIFVENGFVRASESERKRKGPGVIWLDSASAAVLRTPVKFTRTIGPGVHFTAGDEYIAGTTDLHSLTQSVGPLDGDKDDKDPFKITKEKFPDDYEAVQNRRWETSASTRDGIEVLAAMSVTFRISAKEGEGNTQFGFDKENTGKAIRDSLVRTADVSEPVWSQLPAKMAVDVWREYLRMFKLDELFEIAEGRTETALQIISGMVKKRLSQQEVDVLDEFGNVVLKDPQRREDYIKLIKDKKTKEADELVKKKPSDEYSKIKAMGLEVAGVGIKRLIFDPTIEERLLNSWTTSWLKNAKKESERVDDARRLHEVYGQEDAIKEFATQASREIGSFVVESKAQALEMMVSATRRGLLRNPTLLKRTNVEHDELLKIAQWLNKKHQDS